MDGNAQHNVLQQKETVRGSTVTDCFETCIKKMKRRLWLRALKNSMLQQVLNSLLTSVSSRTVVPAVKRN